MGVIHVQYVDLVGVVRRNKMSIQSILDKINVMWPVDKNTYNELMIFGDGSGEVKHRYWSSSYDPIYSFNFDNLKELQHWLLEQAVCS